MNTKRTIVFPFFQFGKFGGTRVITKIANIWSAKNVRILFLTIGDTEVYYPISKDVGIIHFNTKGQMIRYMYRYFEEYDALISTYFLSVYPTFIVSLLRSNFKKNYYYVQAYEPEFEFAKGKKWLKLLAILSYKLPFIRIVNSDIYTNYKNLHAKEVVYPGLDTSLYYPKNTALFNETIKIGCIGRKEVWKGTKDVCEAIKIVRDRSYNVDFYIAFNDFDIVDHFFVKPDGDDKLSAFYRDMDIVVAPGHIQLGAVHYPVIESMAVGTSVITTGYLPADDTNAYIVEVQNPEQIANAIINIVNNRDLAIKKRKKAIEDIQQFAWENVADKFMSIIEREINQNDHAK